MLLFYRPLTQSYQEVARSVFLSTSDKNRMSHSEVQNKVNVLWANAKLFDKGIKLFAGKSCDICCFAVPFINTRIQNSKFQKTVSFYTAFKHCSVTGK